MPENTTEMKHTPGPLFVRKAPNLDMYYVETGPIDRGSVDALSGKPVGPERILTARVSGGKALQDATLYAAAPDLLEFAKSQLCGLPGCTDKDGHWNCIAARKVIAKAEVQAGR